MAWLLLRCQGHFGEGEWCPPGMWKASILKREYHLWRWIRWPNRSFSLFFFFSKFLGVSWFEYWWTLWLEHFVSSNCSSFPDNYKVHQEDGVNYALSKRWIFETINLLVLSNLILDFLPAYPSSFEIVRKRKLSFKASFCCVQLAYSLFLVVRSCIHLGSVQSMEVGWNEEQLSLSQSGLRSADTQALAPLQVPGPTVD